MSLIAELKRRNVIRVAAAYLVAAWLLVQVCGLLLPAFGAPDWVLRVIVLGLAAGFVGAVVFSWVFELTPEGLKREHAVERDESITHLTAKKLDLAVIVLLVAAIGVTIWTHRRAAPTADRALTSGAASAGAQPSLAVLPFVNLSAVAENEYFSDGLTETLLNMLAQVEGLKVTARTSAFAFKGQNKDVREIATTLNVNAVLEGSVQRAGDRVRITAQLIDARDGNHLWSQSYDRTLDDLFAIQDEIAGAVAKELTRQLLGDAAAPKVGAVGTHDAEAYDLYLRGLEQLNIASYASLPEAERRFKQALARDATFADARIAMGKTYLTMAITGLLGWPEAAERGRTLLAPLLAGDNADPRAVAYDARLRWNAAPSPAQRGSAQELEATLDAALASAPNEVWLYLLAADARPDSRSDEALAIIERGFRIDPLSIFLLNQRARRMTSLDRFDEALADYARIREIAPTSVIGYNGPAYVHADRGEYAEVVRWRARNMAIDPDDHELAADAAQYLLLMGLTAEALPWIRRAELLNAAGSDTRRVLIQYAEQSGDRERAIALSREILRERRDNRRWVYGMAAIHYATLMAEAGKTDEALRYFDKVSPGALSLPPPTPESEMDLIVQAIAAGYLVRNEDPAQRKIRADRFRSGILSQDPEFDFDNDVVGALLAAMVGDRKQAIRILAECLPDPQEVVWEWRVGILRDPLLGELTQEPEVAAAIAQLESRLAAQAARYRQLVADGEIEVP